MFHGFSLGYFFPVGPGILFTRAVFPFDPNRPGLVFLEPVVTGPYHRNWCAEKRLDGFQVKHIGFAGQGQGCSGFSGTRGAADPVDVVFRVLGEIIVDHMADVLHVNSPGGDICGHQNPDRTVFELLHELQPFFLGQVSADAFGRESVSLELAGNPFDPGFGVDKHQHAGPILLVQDSQKQGKLLIHAYMEHLLFDVFHRGFFRCHGYEFRQVHEFIGQLQNTVGKGGGKQHGLPFVIARQFFEQKSHIFFKTQIQQPVGFVDDRDADVLGFENSLALVIDDAARGTDDDVRSFPEGIGLFLIVDSADEVMNGQPAVSADPAGFLVNLESQFPGGCDNQGGWYPGGFDRLREKAAENGDQKRRGFSGAGLGLAGDVFSGQGDRKGFRLNRCAPDKSGFGQTTEKRLRKLKLFKTFFRQKNRFVRPVFRNGFFG